MCIRDSPKTSAPEQALQGFLRSNKINKKDLFKKKTEKDEFYFYKTVATSLKTHDLLTEFIPKILSNYQWKKSMKWGEFDLNWGRPLKSILSISTRSSKNVESTNPQFQPKCHFPMKAVL